MGEFYFNVSWASRNVLKDRVTGILMNILRCLSDMIVSCVPVKEKANTNTKVGYSRGRRAEKYSQRIAFFVTDGSCHITLLKNGLIIQALCHREGSLAFSVLSTIYIDQPRRPFTLKHRSWICNSFCLWYWFMPADHFTAPACRLLETTIQFCLCLLPCVVVYILTIWNLDFS